MEADEVLVNKINAADNDESLMAVIAEYAKLSMDKVKDIYSQCCQQIRASFEQLTENRELNDDELDIVTGGGKVGRWFKKHAVSITLGVVSAALVGAAAFCICASGGAAAFAVVGAVGGKVLGGVGVGLGVAGAFTAGVLAGKGQ